MIYRKKGDTCTVHDDIKLSVPIVNCISHSFMYFISPSKLDIQCIEHGMGRR